MLEKKYYINAGADGTFKPSKTPSLQVYDTTPGDMDKIFSELAKNPPEQIVLNFHGGLVSVKKGMASATDFTHEVLAKTKAYPISLVWETGLLETLTQDLSVIRSSKLFKKLLEKIIKSAADKIGVEFSLPSNRSAGNALGLTYTKIQQELEVEIPFENYDIDTTTRSATGGMTDKQLESEISAEMEIELAYDQELLALLEMEKSEQELKVLPMEVLSTNESERSRGIISTLLVLKPLVKIVFRVVKRFLKKRDHGFYPTVIEELIREFYVADLGSLIWSSMKNKGRDMWTENGGSGLNQRAGAYLIGSLERFIGEHPATKIHVLGHSAGSIVACHLMEKLVERESAIRFDQLIFLAPACRCELFTEAILGNRQKFDRFRMFTMADDWETKDRLLPYIYTRSLLYLVSGALENDGKDYDAPILGLQRHNSSEKPYHRMPFTKEIGDFLAGDISRVVYSVTSEEAPPGFRSASKKHGAFNDVGEETMDSVIYLLA